MLIHRAICQDISVVFFHYFGDLRDLHSFPTRRSSDLFTAARYLPNIPYANRLVLTPPGERPDGAEEDRKSTRLNSSHVRISYAVFRSKKKNSISILRYTYPY